MLHRQAAGEIRQLKYMLAKTEARVSHNPACLACLASLRGITLGNELVSNLPTSRRTPPLPPAQVTELVAQANGLTAAVEGLTDDNEALRKLAGMPPHATVDTAGVRLAREVAAAQLRSVNAMLERQVRAALPLSRYVPAVTLDSGSYCHASSAGHPQDLAPLVERASCLACQPATAAGR